MFVQAEIALRNSGFLLVRSSGNANLSSKMNMSAWNVGTPKHSLMKRVLRSSESLGSTQLDHCLIFSSEILLLD